MNLKEIKEIINLMNENDLVEIEVEREGGKIKIKKTASGYVMQPASGVAPQHFAEPATAPKQAPAPAPDKNLKEITSPMVGTFYRASSPEAAPFVEVGQVVEIGQAVCIIEAMKLMNEIKSEIRGKVEEVAVDNAQPVEFGQVLFLIEPI